MPDVDTFVREYHALCKRTGVSVKTSTKRTLTVVADGVEFGLDAQALKRKLDSQ